MLHLRLAATFAVLGFVFTSKQWLQWLNKYSPETGLIIKHFVILLSIYILAWSDPYIKFVHHHQAIGILLLYVTFVMIFNYQSEWIKDIKADNVEEQTFDGVVYHRSKQFLNIEPQIARIVSFVIIPFILVIIGSQLVHRKQNVNL
jgi:hypothetical protein